MMLPMRSTSSVRHFKTPHTGPNPFADGPKSAQSDCQRQPTSCRRVYRQKWHQSLPSLGTEFIPVMDEGAFDMDFQLIPGASLNKALEIARLVQERLK